MFISHGQSSSSLSSSSTLFLIEFSVATTTTTTTTTTNVYQRRRRRKFSQFISDILGMNRSTLCVFPCVKVTDKQKGFILLSQENFLALSLYNSIFLLFFYQNWEHFTHCKHVHISRRAILLKVRLGLQSAKSILGVVMSSFSFSLSLSVGCQTAESRSKFGNNC